MSGRQWDSPHTVQANSARGMLVSLLKVRKAVQQLVLKASSKPVQKNRRSWSVVKKPKFSCPLGPCRTNKICVGPWYVSSAPPRTTKRPARWERNQALKLRQLHACHAIPASPTALPRPQGGLAAPSEVLAGGGSRCLA